MFNERFNPVYEIFNCQIFDSDATYSINGSDVKELAEYVENLMRNKFENLNEQIRDLEKELSWEISARMRIEEEFDELSEENSQLEIVNEHLAQQNDFLESEVKKYKEIVRELENV